MQEEQIQDLINNMNEELGLYIPGDVTNDEEKEKYNQLFSILRNLNFSFNALETDEAKNIFYSYYNGSDEIKEQILLQNQQRLEELQSEDQQLEEIDDEEELTKMKYIFELLDQNEKVNYLYLLENGEYPDDDTDKSKYVQMVKEYEEGLQEVLNQLNQEQQVVEEGYKSLTPQQIANRYLEGAGVYDPSSRNSGLRVDDKL